MVLPTELIDPINSLQQNMFINAPTISQTAALRCWDSAAISELESHIAKYRTNRTHILEQMARIDPVFDIQNKKNNNVAPADGGFYIYIDLGHVMSDECGSVAMCAALLEEYHTAFTPGVDFEDPSSGLGNRRFRISYSQGTDVIIQAMSNFRKFWPTWKERVQQQRRQTT